MHQKKMDNINKSLFIFPKKNENAQLRIFCFPYAGGGASIYSRWELAMPLEVDLCIAQLPGRENRRHENAFRSFSLLINVLSEEITPLLNKPYVLFGHSMGALICFELARKLRETNNELPMHIFLSGLAPPKSVDKSEFSYNIMCDSDVIDLLDRINGTPKEILKDRELLEVFLPVVKADFELLNSYFFVAQNPLECPITSYHGINDNIPISEISNWTNQTKKGFKIKIFQGDHFFINSSRDSVLTALRADLRMILNEINELSYLEDFQKRYRNEELLTNGSVRGGKQRALTGKVNPKINL